MTTAITDSNQCNSGAQCADIVWTPILVTAPGTTKFVAYMPMPANEDIDSTSTGMSTATTYLILASHSLARRPRRGHRRLPHH